MHQTTPTLPAHDYDEGLSIQILDYIRQEICDHNCDLRPDHLYIPEHDLVLRARAGVGDKPELIHAYIWAEHERWLKPAVGFVIGFGNSEDESARKIAKDWASGFQPSICKLFHDPRNPPSRMTTQTEGSGEGTVPWRVAPGQVHGWSSEPMELLPESFLLNTVLNDVCGLMHKRELISLLVVSAWMDGRHSASVYCDGHLWDRASATLRDAVLPARPAYPRAFCQKLFCIFEPCSWDDVDRDKYPALNQPMEKRASVEPAPVKSKEPWWKWILGGK